MTDRSEEGAIRFGEKLLTLLDAGSFTATYKYAVLVALLDLCLEQADGKRPPQSLDGALRARACV